MPTVRKQFYKRWWFRILVSVLIVLISYEIFERWVDAKDLEVALAEADRKFPTDWRVPEVLAKMPPPTPPDKDPLQILATWEPNRIGSLFTVEASEALTRLSVVGPSFRPDADQLALFRKTLLSVKPHLDLFEPFRTTRDVYHPLDWKENYLEIQLGHTQSMRWLTAFNTMRAVIALEEKNEKEAIESLLAIHHSLSWLHQEPILISPLVRIACFQIEIDLLERMLGQGEIAPAALKSISDLIEAEIKIDPLRIGLRMDMGAADRLVEAVLAGRIQLGALSGTNDKSSPAYAWLFLRYFGNRNRANLLREMGAIREIVAKDAKPSERSRFIKELEQRLTEKQKENDRTYLFARVLLPAFSKVHDASVRFVALGRTAIGAIAFERYRRDHGKWPMKWEELTPNYLASIPIDPFDDQPLKFKRIETGVVIYSIGLDGIDNGGRINRERRWTEGSDFGFELSDAEHRRQPSPAKPVDPEAKE